MREKYCLGKRKQQLYFVSVRPGMSSGLSAYTMILSSLLNAYS
nr:MAG TPA: hypothetical protein [Caudoviricetes sp.]